MCWESGLCTIIISTLSTLIIYVITIKVIKYFMKDAHIPIRDVSKQHNWTNIKGNTKVFFFNFSFQYISGIDDNLF